MRTRIAIPATMVALSFMGCSFDAANDGLTEPSTGSVFGGPSKNELFALFQGDWHFEDRQFDPQPKHVAISGGPDVTITGHIIRFGSGLLVREIRLCQTVATADGIECEGWHHEDIHDPGDMQRVDCKLRRIGDNIEFSWRILASDVFSDDPVIADSDYARPDRPGEQVPWWIETYSPKAAK